jgi:hypothetical protein
MIRWAMLLLCAPVVAGCGGTIKSIKEKLDPKASVLGVSIVEVTPQYVTVKVDVKTEDVDLMLGMVKMKYKLTLIETSKEQTNDSVLPAELMNLRDSGFSFLVKIPLDKAGSEDQKVAYLIQGSIVFKVIAKIADVKFSHQGDLKLNP